MIRSLHALGIAVVLLLGTSVNAGELDAEFGPTQDQGNTTPSATAGATEMDAETPSGAWRHGRFGGCGFGFGRGFGLGGFGRGFGFGGYGLGMGYGGLGYGLGGFGLGYGGLGGYGLGMGYGGLGFGGYYGGYTSYAYSSPFMGYGGYGYGMGCW